jgi:glutathione synthase
VFASARAVSLESRTGGLSLGSSEIAELSALDAVFIRKDPPFDPAYVHLTHQLDLVKRRTLVLNDPQGLRDANEKLFAFHFTQFMPDSLVTSSPARILDFVREVGGRAVLKPLDGAGGSGVVALSTEDKNTRALVDLLTGEGRRLALVQQFLPDIRSGDKRVLMLEGRVLGAILRVPREDDIRANIHVGGSVFPTTLTDAETAMVTEIGATLKAHGLWFVGLDLIGGRLIEVNVTSPTGIQELGRHTGDFPEQKVIAWVEERARAIKRG